MFSVDVRCVLAIECLFIFLMTPSVQAQPRLENELHDVVVREGDTVDFVCDLTDTGSYTISWFYQEQKGLYLYLTNNRRLGLALPPQLQQRLSIIGNESQDEFTLRITDVQETDEGTYSCLYSEAETETAGTAKLTVLVPPSPESPWCSVLPESGAVGDYVTLYCNSALGKPVPNITYYRANEWLAGPATNSMRHWYQLQAQDNGVTFTCIMTTPALDEPGNCSVTPLRILPQATIPSAVSTVEVPEWVQTTVTEGLTVTERLTANPGRTGEPSLLPVVPIAAVVAVAVIVMVIVLVIFVRRRKQQRKPKIPIDSKDGFRMRVTEGEYDKLTPGQDGRTVGGDLPHEADNQGTVNGADAFSRTVSHSEPDTRPKANGKDVRSLVESPAAAHQDTPPLYAQLDKPKNARKTEEVTGSEYSSVPMEEPEPAAADFGLVYADLDLQSPGTATVDTGPASASEQTVYAMIRT